MKIMFVGLLYLFSFFLSLQKDVTVLLNGSFQNAADVSWLCSCFFNKISLYKIHSLLSCYKIPMKLVC